MGFPWASLATELSLLLLGLGLLCLDIVIADPRRKHVIGYVALAGLLLCLLPAAGVCTPENAPGLLFGGLYAPDDFHRFFKLLAVLTTALVTLLSFDYLEHIRIDRGVYFTILVFAALAVVLLAGANDLILIYLCFEYLSISSYILVGFILGRDKEGMEEIKRSSEASLKYLIYGAVASAVMLYGFSLLYGLAGSTALPRIAEAYGQPGSAMLKLVAVALVMVGMGFKLAAAPFHMWAPDVYEGAPTPVAAFLAVASKAGAFAVLARFLILGLGVEGFSSDALDWRVLLALVAVVTMFVGNLLALVQINLKRLLGYSSVAHAGYMLAAVVCNQVADVNGRPTMQLDGVQSLLVYLAAYLFMTLGAFAVVVWYQRSSHSELIEDLAGLARPERAPGVAFAMMIFMLSLTGIPPTAGFVGKMLILRATVISSTYWWLGLAIVVNSVISAFYYVNIMRVMYLQPPKPGIKLRPAFCSPVVIGLCCAATLLIIIQFGVLLDITDAPLRVFLG